ncbi:DUF3046 domain-containing protein [Homoserinibacter sp. YIM 151385]|uniref:DUF3046 domain-containing protein n=1 Tax=Homoserinibacter sp. YIM 151385 TaxID=2985506 RepID=UPI0022F06415|nr:DUF3046 domain-containing protein [Homoserinibacter sp. YIM 151385]WBU38898.1 DUF3046 domain-containing protein [Homoserinibacter sp. YIM 151385]
MKISEFRRAVDDEFGAGFGRVLVRDSVLADLGDRTPEEALEAGLPAREVWLALCRSRDVPVDRRHGVGLPDPRS